MELKKYKLGDLCTFINGRAYLQPELQNSGKYKIVRVGNLSGGNNSWYYSDMELEPTKYCAKGDLLYAWACNFGPYIWKGDKTIYHYHIWKVINSEQIDKMYLYYLLKFMTNSFMGCVHGSTMLHITKENMESMEVRIHASIEEQRRIATILNKLDCKIGLNRQINDNLEAMAKQLYDYWFVQFDFPNEEGKPYKSSGGAMVWNEKLKREIPQGWHCYELNKWLEIKSGFAFKSETYISKGKFKVVTIKNVQDHHLDTSSCDYVYEIPQGMKEWCSLSVNDRLISLTGNCGRLCIVTEKDLLLNQRVGLLACNDEYIDYAYLLLSSEEYQTLSNNLAKGAAQANLSPVDLCKNIAVLPKLDVLEKFNRQIKPIVASYIQNEIQIADLTKQRDELLPLLMNGQASVNSD